MDTDTDTKIAVITGGSRGLGKSTALQLAQRQVSSVITYQSKKADAEAVVAVIQRAGAKAVALQLDVGNSASFGDFAGSLRSALQKTFNRDRFDHLVNNAGTGLHGSLMETTEAQFDELYRVHLKGTFFLTQKLLPLMEDGGSIVNLSSGLARFVSPGYVAYAAMKGGIEVLTRYMARELGARRITVNTLAPGPIATDFGGGAVRDNAQLNQMLASVTALGRVGEPDDIGCAIASLLTSEHPWITGQRIEASGGMNL